MITGEALREGLKQIAKQPFRLVPYFDPGVWGGQWMKEVCEMCIRDRDEAIIMNCDQKQLFLIEKKYTIDGKPDFYLNPQWIKGEEKLTDKQKISTMKKVIKKMDDIYNVNDGKALPLMKQEIQEKIDLNQPVKPLEVVKKVLEKDYQAQEESEIMMKDLGIGEEDQIQSLSFCLLYTSTK